MAGSKSYTARKSLWSEVTFLRIILCLLIIPIFYLIFKLVQAGNETAVIYGDRAILKSGVFNKSENEILLIGISAVSVEQSFKGRIFDYGTVRVDILGKNDFRISNVVNPEGLKRFLQQYINADKLRAVLAN